MTSLGGEFSAEFRFLTNILQPALSKSSEPDQNFDWDFLLALAARHRVAPGLATGLERAGFRPPEAVRVALEPMVRQAALDELALAATLREICRVSAEAGLRVAVLKGIALSFMLHGRLGQRISRDIDLLVTPDDAWRALLLLAGLGFRPTQGGAMPDQPAFARLMDRSKDIELVHPTRKQLVELHWRLFDNPRLLALPQPLPLEPVSLPMGLDLLVLPSDLNLLYLATHGCQHGWSRLKWLADFAGLAARLDGEALAVLHRRTSPADGKRALAQALLLSAGLFGLTLSPALEASLRRDVRVRALLAAARHCMAASGPAELETLRFGSTVKNLSHYLLCCSPAYLLAEAHLDITDRSAERTDGQARRFGLLGRLFSWLTRHIGASSAR